MTTAPTPPTSALAASKTCQICGQDCSAKPRIKDAQGRYACRECVEQRQAAKKAAAHSAAPPVPPQRSSRPTPPPLGSSAAAGATGFNMLDGLQQAPDGRLIDKSMVPCPSCTKPMPAGGLICVQCGYNTQSGRVQRTKVIKEKKQSSASAEPGVGLALAALWVPLGLGVFGLAIGIPVPAVALLIGMAIGFVHSVAHLAIICVAVTERETGWAVGIFFLGQLAGIPYALRGDHPVLRNVYLSSLGGSIIAVIGFFIGGGMAVVEAAGTA